MKKQLDKKQDSKEFTNFETIVRKIVSVPKSELEKRGKEAKKQKEQRKAMV